MNKFLFFSLIFVLITPTASAESYIATRQELWFSDSSYYKTSHHIKIGKSMVINKIKVFGELGVGEDINEELLLDQVHLLIISGLVLQRHFMIPQGECKLSKQNEICWTRSKLGCNKHKIQVLKKCL